MESPQKKIKQLVDQVRQQVLQAEAKLEKALQERDNILAMPISKEEVKKNFSYAVDKSANKFQETLKNTISGRARKRNVTGIKKHPDVIRSPGQYNELNLDALNFFLGTTIKQKVSEFIDEMDYFGVTDGIDEVEYNQLLETVDIKINELEKNRDSIISELNLILK